MRSWLHALESPLGPLLVAANHEGALVYLGFAEHEPRQALLLSLEATQETLTWDSSALDLLRNQLDGYFRGSRQRFSVPLDLRGTAFRRRVWEELQRIPFGATLSYGELAKRLGDPKLSRAVGAANGANPVSILVPCHRVIGGNGRLTGYAGGLGNKEALLGLELALAQGKDHVRNLRFLPDSSENAANAK